MQAPSVCLSAEQQSANKSTVLCQKDLSDISMFLQERQKNVILCIVLTITFRQVIHNYAHNCQIN